MSLPKQALWLWYRGTRFSGYQRQPSGSTVQQALEGGLRACGIDRTPIPSGRTDLGVHARMQVVGFRGKVDDQTLERLNAVLPSDVGALALQTARPGFHPQFACTGKEYRYRVQLRGKSPPGWEPYAWNAALEFNTEVNAQTLQRLLTRCLGRRDFIAFHEKSSARKLRTLEAASVVPINTEGLCEVRFRGSGFGRYQVRYLMGSALAVAVGQLPERDFEAALDDGIEMRGLKAPAQGLILWDVLYAADVDPFFELRRRPALALPSGPPFETVPG